MRPLATVTMWISIDPATKENGCLRVEPRTHRSGLMRHVSTNEAGLALNQGLSRDEFDDSTAVDIILEPGQISLHDSMRVH